MKLLNEKKLLKIINNMNLDFKNSTITGKGLNANIENVCKEVIKGKSLDASQAKIIYVYVDKQLNSKSLDRQFKIALFTNTTNALSELIDEWRYLKEWIESKYKINK